MWSMETKLTGKLNSASGLFPRRNCGSVVRHRVMREVGMDCELAGAGVGPLEEPGRGR